MNSIKKLFLKLFPTILFDYKNHRRYCKRCGQQQDLFGTDYERPWTNFEWFEDMGPTINEACICHTLQGDPGVR
jgi:hypothetical protein